MRRNQLENFEIRAYTKKELSLLYFPDSTPHSAVNRLMSWIKNANDIHEELAETGYKKTSKWLSPRQVQLLVDAFGEP